jgi:hypothetical protein
MNTRKYMLATTIIGGILSTVVLSGCYSYSTITKQPDFSDNIAVVPNDSKSDRIGYISSIDAKHNNAVKNIDENRVLGKLRESKYFNVVTYGLWTKQPDVPAYDLRFIIEENFDTHNVANGFKAFFSGFTLGLLAPVLPGTYDYSTDHYLLATRPDGTKREYKASCAGSATGTYPYTELVDESTKVVRDLNHRCLTSVINQFTRDK